MKYYKMYVDENQITELPKDKVIDEIEGSGYYKNNTVIDILNSGQIIRTPFAYYSNSKENLNELL